VDGATDGNRWTATMAQRRTVDAKARRTSALAFRGLRRRTARVGDGPHWLSVSERFRLGGGQPIEEVVRLIFLHFYFPITTLYAVQLLLAVVAPMWWRVGSSFLSHPHGLTLYIAVFTVKAFIRGFNSCRIGGGTKR
jgi:hypothetical protein